MNKIRKFFLALLPALLFSGVASAAVLHYSVTFDGPSESPANASPGTGLGTVDYDNVAHTLTLQMSFSGLLGTTTASHIHAATVSPFAGTAGVATTTPSFATFPLGVNSGSYSDILDLTLASSYNPSYVTAHGGTTTQAEADLTAAMAAGTAYWNVHSNVNAGGEIRGFLTPVVPIPPTVWLLGTGCLSLLSRLRRKATV